MANTSTRASQTKARQEAFLAAYSEAGTIRAACEAAGVTRSAFQQWERKDINSFRIQFQISKELFREQIQDIAFDRVKSQKPNDTPVLLITLLNAHWPEKYRRDGQVASSEVKEMMVEWKKWVKENNSGKKKEDVDTEKAHTSAIDEVERLLAKRNNPNEV